MIGLLVVLSTGVAGQVAAQQTPTEKRPQATRAELEALWSKLQGQQRSYPEAQALRDRLDHGDFQVGDRVILHVTGDTSLTNTFTVNGNRGLDLPNIGEVSLDGVLRSEIETHLRTAMSRYLKNVDLRAESLMRVTVIGQVNKPGVVNVPATSLLGDLFGAAGGLTPTSDLAKSVIRRNSQEIVPNDKLKQAITDGKTLDQLNMRSGDELEVAEKKKGTATNAILLVGALAAAVLSIIALVNLAK